jgi:hypothetical protein
MRSGMNRAMLFSGAPGGRQLMDRIWYYAEGAQPIGPLSLSDLKAVLSRIPHAQDVVVWRDGFLNWQPAKDIPELLAVVIKPPPLPSVPPPLLTVPSVSAGKSASAAAQDTHAAESASQNAPDSAQDKAAQPARQYEFRVTRLWYFLLSLCLPLILSLVFASIGITQTSFLVFPYYIIVFILTIGRLHDTGSSGWTSLLLLVPIVNIIVWVWLLFARSGEAYAYQPKQGERVTHHRLGIGTIAAIITSAKAEVKFDNGTTKRIPLRDLRRWG